MGRNEISSTLARHHQRPRKTTSGNAGEQVEPKPRPEAKRSQAPHFLTPMCIAVAWGITPGAWQRLCYAPRTATVCAIVTIATPTPNRINTSPMIALIRVSPSLNSLHTRAPHRIAIRTAAWLRP